jgi:ABC-2 type transport system permease protein
MRWLLVKDLQILRRSPLLVGLLIVYPILIALMIGFALSSPPGKPKVAFYSEVQPGKGKLQFGQQKVNISDLQGPLFQSIDRVKVNSTQEAIDAVKNGDAVAAVVVPADIITEMRNLVTTGVGSPTVEVYLNSKDPLERQFVNDQITARVNQFQQAVSKLVLQAAVSDLQQVLNGGQINFAGENVNLLGLRNSKAIIEGAVASLPANSPLKPALRQVVAFADLAIQGLSFANPVLGSIGSPLTVDVTQLAGSTTPTDSYAVAIAVIVSLMFVTLLLAAAMLALERTEHAYSRLIRGLVSPNGLLSEKILLAAGCAAVVTLVMSACISPFVHLEWARFGLWVAALALGGLAFGALGVAIGAIGREVSTASLMAFLLSLPIAFVALVPANAVSGALKTVLDAISFVFPFKAALQAASNAFSGASPGIGWPLLHLLVLTVVFAGLARLALRRFVS